MFKKGDFVVNTNNGICEINDIITMNMSGIDKEYYLLVPIAEQTAKVYIPVDMASQRIRLAMSKKDALELIESIKDIDEAYIENEKEREKTYKEALNSRDPKRLVGIIKTLYLRKQERVEAGKKNTAVDERYFKLAENHLHSELAFALQVNKEKVQEMILDTIQQN
ncbi:MAG: CarD family transcriptional regulator [Agathobacter sp.]|nr:CarD family transcriptional regulator [Agathobacter sp.]